MTDNATDFKGWAKIHRLAAPPNADDRREMVITEKIDGTNAQILIVPEDEANTNVRKILDAIDGLAIFAGSRKRYLTPGSDDNFGFAEWVLDHAPELMRLGEGRHYGEWWGSGINRGYGLPKGERRFSLFDYKRWSVEFNDEQAARVPSCVSVVPIIGIYDAFDTNHIFNAYGDLLMGGSWAAQGHDDPEGVVAEHLRSRLLLKYTGE